MTSNEQDPGVGVFQPGGDSPEALERAFRVREVIKEAGGRTKLADRTGIPANTLATYAKGVEMKLTNAVRIADACDVTVEWLATGRAPHRRPKQGEAEELERVTSFQEGPQLRAPHRDENSKYSVLPSYNVDRSGHLGYKSRQIVQHITFDTAWLIENLKVSPSNVFLANLWDNDMTSGFALGDTVMIDTSWRETRHGEVYAIGLGDRITLRRLVATPKGDLLLVDDLGVLEPIDVQAGDRFMSVLQDQKTLYFGRVVWHARSV